MIYLCKNERRSTDNRRILKASPRTGEAVALATDEVALIALMKRRGASLQVQTPQPHPSPSAPPSPILGEGLRRAVCSIVRQIIIHHMNSQSHSSESEIGADEALKVYFLNIHGDSPYLLRLSVLCATRIPIS